jgi:hypothetical protein
MAAVVATLVALTVTAPPAEPAPGILTAPVYAGAGLDAAPITDIEAFAWQRVAELEEQRQAEAAAAEAAALALAAEQAAAERSSRVPPTGGTVAAPLERTTTGPPHSDAWWWGVAQCEQGGRNDAYYGYFSFMDGSQGGRPWADQVAAGNALLIRAGREIGPWAASCVAAGYRASPGG